VAQPTERVPVASGPRDQAALQGGVRDLTGERLSQLAGYEADCSAAMSAGMSAEHDRRNHYATDVLPQGTD
jgi:hypothetical protein